MNVVMYKTLPHSGSPHNPLHLSSVYNKTNNMKCLLVSRHVSDWRGSALFTGIKKDIQCVYLCVYCVCTVCVLCIMWSHYQLTWMKTNTLHVSISFKLSDKHLTHVAYGTQSVSTHTCSVSEPLTCCIGLRSVLIHWPGYHNLWQSDNEKWFVQFDQKILIGKYLTSTSILLSSSRELLGSGEINGTDISSPTY